MLPSATSQPSSSPRREAIQTVISDDEDDDDAEDVPVEVRAVHCSRFIFILVLALWDSYALATF